MRIRGLRIRGRRHASTSTVKASRVAEMYSQSAALLAALDLPETFTIAELHTQVETHRERSVHLVARPMPNQGPCGLWIAGEHDDYIFYESDTSPLHQRAIVGHEFGHVLFADKATPASLKELATALLPDIDSAAIHRLRGRSRYDETCELRAEIFASVVVERSGPWSAAPPTSTDPAVLARISATLEARQHGEK